LLHGHASVGHLDPRLGRVILDETGPGLRPTGSTPTCASKWNGDAIYDMVGNLDEWLDEKGGAFAGGFYARGTKSGCDALVDSHPSNYLDYSTGVRCCKDAS
jgi:sulfatase modifying factor 1